MDYDNEESTGAGEESPQVTLPARQDEVLPDKIYLLPMGDRPFFPPQTLPIMTPEQRWLQTVERVGSTPHHMVGMCRTTQPPEEMPKPEHFAQIGTVVRMHNAQRADGRVQFIAEGIRRFRILRWISDSAPYLVQVEYPEIPAEDPAAVKAYGLAIINTIKELLPLNPLYKEQLRAFLDRFNAEDPSPLADFAAVLTSTGGAELQEVLEAVPLLERMQKVLVLLRKEVDVAGMQARIQQSVQESMNKRQKEFFLREQLRATQQELGISKDDKTVELERFTERLKELEVPAAVQERIDSEMQKLSFLETGSPEYAVTRNYLDTITSLPWGKYSEDKLDLKRARKILNRDHEGLEDVKQRII
jgi:ATP-dependent Lon protease